MSKREGSTEKDAVSMGMTMSGLVMVKSLILFYQQWERQIDFKK